MMDDTDRKILRVMWNLYRFNAARINVGRLSRLSGRSKDQITGTLTRLCEERYIKWDEASATVQVIELDERKPLKAESYA